MYTCTKKPFVKIKFCMSFLFDPWLYNNEKFWKNITGTLYLYKLCTCFAHFVTFHDIHINFVTQSKYLIIQNKMIGIIIIYDGSMQEWCSIN